MKICAPAGRSPGRRVGRPPELAYWRPEIPAPADAPADDSERGLDTIAGGRATISRPPVEGRAS